MAKTRKTFIMLILLILLNLVSINIVDAHSVLENATPKEGAKLEQSIKSIELSFNTKIENGSTFYLVNEKKVKLEPNAINITENVLKGIFDEQLVSGTYQVNWKILGADGHIIENKYSFTITESTKNEEQVTQTHSGETEDDPQDGTSKSQNDKTDADQKNFETNQQNDSQQMNSENEQSLLVPIIIITLIIIGIILLAWMWFK